MIYININKVTNFNKFNLWLHHYKNNLRIDYVLYLDIINNNDNNSDINSIVNANPDKIKNTIPTNGILLTENDFLFSYCKNNDDVMDLSYNINDEVFKQSILIGKVFQVPTKKKTYTTFEIPDFIIYKHSDHTNYTLDGIKINNGDNISDNIVCLSLESSRVAFENEYYETNILFQNDTSQIVSKNFYSTYAHNVYTNKEKKYAIIWHAKCGCSSIKELFCFVNNINNHQDLLHNFKKYRYNNYLQNIDIISFVRNPYHRFISCYFNKHVDKCHECYLTIPNYINYLSEYKDDTLLNFAKYSKNTIIDEHTEKICNFYYNKYNLKYKLYKIEDGINHVLSNFLKNYHDRDTEINILITNQTSKAFTNNGVANKNFKNYKAIDWLKYKSENYNQFPNYADILDDELKNVLFEIYENDFITLQYDHDVTLIENRDTDYRVIFLKLFDDLYPEFDWMMYVKINKDLNNLDEYSAKNHYYRHGCDENRKIA
jgi:hypothetical protein